MPARRLPLLLHQQRRRVGRDRAQVRALRDRPVARPVRRPRLPRAHDRRARAQRRHASSATASASCSRAARRCRSATSTRWSASCKVGDVAAFVVEPIQGKGVFVAPDDYLRAAADLCHASGALLAIDEVQTGLGRTGTFFAFEQWGVGARPRDRREGAVRRLRAGRRGHRERATIVEKVFDTMDRAVVHSSTFGQNVLAMTAGLATLHTIDAESIVEHAGDGRRRADRQPADAGRAARARARGARPRAS